MDGAEARSLARALARRCLRDGVPQSAGEAGRVLERACELAGLKAGGLDLRRLFLAEFLLALLSQANAVYAFPYSERELLCELLPVWLEIFAALERPPALQKALQRHYREFEDFPVPARLLAWLPESATGRATGREEREGSFTQGFGRSICEKVVENCRVLRFRKSGEG